MRRLIWGCAAVVVCAMGIGSAPAEAQGTVCDSPCKIIPLPLVGRPGAVCDSPCKLILLPLVTHSARVSQASLPFVVAQVAEKDMPVPPSGRVMGAVYLDFQADKAAKEIAGTVALHYPDSLKVEKVEGEVVAEFIVDTLGIPDAYSLRILKSTHPFFAAAVRDALPAMRFTPAEIKGVKVKVLIQRPFVFDIAH